MDDLQDGPAIKPTRRQVKMRQDCGSKHCRELAIVGVKAGVKWALDVVPNWGYKMLPRKHICGIGVTGTYTGSLECI
mgnify:CR=1 FL=1